MAYIRLDSSAFFHNINALQERLYLLSTHTPQTHLPPHIAPSAQRITPIHTNTHYPLTHAKRRMPKDICHPSLALVLKDNAYGHGLQEIAQLAHQCGITSVFVKNITEALQITQYFPMITVLYGDIPPTAPINILASIPSLHALKQCLSSHAPRHARFIELKIDIGMHRNGIASCDIAQAFSMLDDAPHITLAGVFAHNGYGDNDDDAFFHSLEHFALVKEQVKALCLTHNRPLPRFHSLSTSGTMRLLEDSAHAQYLLDDVVRIGIGAYGYHTSEMPLSMELHPVASLFAKKISTLILQPGDRIGYGGISMATGGAYSTYDVGYGDGLFRVGKEQVGLTCASGEQILPVMSMDCFSCKGDSEEVCVFNDARVWARAFATIPYVILTHLSPHIPRIVI